MKINENFLKIESSYLFSTVAKKQREYQAAHPDADVIRLSIGDVTKPLAPAVIDAMHKAVDEMANEAILKEIKSVREQIDTCPADRTELLDEYRKRYEIMSEFAPKMLSAEEVSAILQEKFSDVLATKNKGQIMKAVMPELKGKADGKVINQVVAELTK